RQDGRRGFLIHAAGAAGRLHLPGQRAEFGTPLRYLRFQRRDHSGGRKLLGAAGGRRFAQHQLTDDALPARTVALRTLLTLAISAAGGFVASFLPLPGAWLIGS